MTESTLKTSILRIAAAEARKAREWTARRNRAIRAAYVEGGASLREIGEATGLSHEAVRKILDRMASSSSGGGPVS
jgi:DNA-binding MarR family transcriptional regulator